MHANVRRVVDAATALGLSVDIRQFPEGTRTAEDAARAIGCELGQIVKSLVFVVDGTPVMALVSGSNRLDEKKLAIATEGAVVERGDADVVRRATSYPIGGVPPFGHPEQLRTVIDEDFQQYAEIWAAAGTPHDVFAVTLDDLIRVTGGELADLRA